MHLTQKAISVKVVPCSNASETKLKAIQGWPCGECCTETEQDAIAFRALRALELEIKIKAIAARN